MADVPFARLDTVLLLIKNHLKGDIPDMLNDKDNRVFLDYLAGGQNRKIAQERAANAASDGVLSVAARNLAGAGEAQEELMVGKEQLTVVKEITYETRELTVSLVKAKEAFVDFAQTRMAMNQQEHVFDMKRKTEAHELDTCNKKQMLDLELDGKKQMLDLDLDGKKRMLELRAEEARVEEMYARARLLVAQAAAAAVAVPVPSAPEYRAAPPVPLFGVVVAPCGSEVGMSRGCLAARCVLYPLIMFLDHRRELYHSMPSNTYKVMFRSLLPDHVIGS